jgi:hypothetical protein
VWCGVEFSVGGGGVGEEKVYASTRSMELSANSTARKRKLHA